MKKKCLVAAFVGLSACVAPSAPEAETSVTLAGSEWALKGTDASPYIQFKADGTVSGNGGCNQFGGTFSADANRLSFGPMRATKMACPALKAEQEFFSALANTRRMQASHLTLSLQNESGDVLMTLRRQDWD